MTEMDEQSGGEQKPHNSFSRELTEAHRAQLAESALSQEIIEARGYQSVFGPTTIKEREHRFSKAQMPIKSGGLLIPSYRLGNPQPYAYVLRRDKPRSNSKGKPVKYEWPKNVPAIMDVLPLYRRGLRDSSIPIWITEGAKKADALAAAFGDKIVPVNLNGVYGWRTRTDALHKATASLSDLDEVPWQGREVVVAFDSDLRFNRNVRDGVTRLARVLSSRGAKVLMLVLPQEKDGEKLGVDDYLAQGHTVADLEAHLQTLSEAASVGREKFAAHPETGTDLYFPRGWVNAHNAICIETKGGVEVIYPGRIAVYAVGVDATSGIEMLEVRFKSGDNRTVSIVAPRAELATRKGTIAHLTSRGAHIHEGNALHMVRYLADFVAENQDALPRRVFSDRLGNLPDGTLVTPTTAVGSRVKYTGGHTSQPTDNADAFAQTVKELAQWSGAWPLWLELGFSLASPLMQRLGVRRNPVICSVGDSNTGKTSTAYFALAAWVLPGQHPFVMQGVRTTAAGIAQSLEEVGGLPVLLDEAHTIPQVDRLEGAVYAFANGQTYTRGGRDGKARGGTPLSGVLLLVGEAISEFSHAGSRNRVLCLDADKAPPLGTDATRGSELGRERAEVLEAAWKEGAGHLGPRVIEAVLSDWPNFKDTVNGLRAAPEFVRLADWGESCAIMFATLGVMLHLLGLDIPEDVAALPQHVAQALSTAREEQPAHLAAWENIMTMVAQSERFSRGESDRSHLTLRGELIGWSDEEFLYILVGSPPYEQRVGTSATRLHGRRWAEAGLIELTEKGHTTWVKWPPGGACSARVLLIRREAIAQENGQ